MADNYVIFKIILFVKKKLQQLDNAFGKRRNVTFFYGNERKPALVKFMYFSFPKLKYLFLYRYFVLEICIYFYGLVKAASEDKSFEIIFNFVSNSFDNKWTHQIHFGYLW